MQNQRAQYNHEPSFSATDELTGHIIDHDSVQSQPTSAHHRCGLVHCGGMWRP
uniref:Uncharacterized protein n=1 Tax=Arundo donax TaxID=35708 RepID=A0A0A9HNI3_ARUDO